MKKIRVLNQAQADYLNINSDNCYFEGEKILTGHFIPKIEAELDKLSTNILKNPQSIQLQTVLIVDGNEFIMTNADFSTSIQEAIKNNQEFKSLTELWEFIR